MKTVKLLDTYDPNLSEEIREEIRELWADMEYGNDVYYHTTALSWLKDEGTMPHIIEYLEKKVEDGELQPDETILIHDSW